MYTSVQIFPRNCYMDDVIINKSITIDRCLTRIKEEYSGCADNLYGNPSRQDAIILNIQRACETLISLGMHIAKKIGYKNPLCAKDVFPILETHSIITSSFYEQLQKLISLRKIPVYISEKVNVSMIESIIKTHLEDFKTFIKIAKSLDSVVKSIRR